MTSMRIAALLASLCAHLLASQNPRILVLTDISSLTAGLREPDDGQSLIRLLFFSSEFEIEGLIASSNLGHGQIVRPELIHQAIDAYAQVWPNLRLHRSSFPNPDRLRALVRPGQPLAGPSVPVTSSIGDGKSTPASDLILRAGTRPSTKPLWILIWGGSADLAQALTDLRRLPASQQRRFFQNVRVHAIGDQDSTGEWIRREFPTLYYMKRERGYRGMYRAGDPALASPEWVTTSLPASLGPLAALYPNYRGGDIWTARLGPVRGVKEGDSPSFLALFPNGLSDPNRPELGSWGGRMIPQDPPRLRWNDATDPGSPASDPDPRLSTVYRWRPAFPNELATRAGWSVLPASEANHPPIPRARKTRFVGRPSTAFRLDASASSDPDGDPLDFAWEVYPADDSVQIQLDPTRPSVITVAASGPPRLVHILARISDRRSVPLTRYLRFTLELR